MWAVAGGPARKPGVVITNGSVQAPEELYWAQAAALARIGYVVLTWDPNGATGASRDYSGAGVQTMQVNTRAGTHFESGFIPNPGFPATLRGTDVLRSRVDIRRSVGGRALCEDLRTGCGLLVDDRAGPFSAVDFAYGRRSLRPVRPARCASAIRVPRRLNLSRAKRRLRVRLRLSDRTRARAGVRRRSGRARSGRRVRTLKAGRRTLVVRLRRRARPGHHRLTLRLHRTTGLQTTRAPVRVVR